MTPARSYQGRCCPRLDAATYMEMVPGAQAPELVAKGEAELGVAQGSEIVSVPGAEILGPLPANLGSVTLFTAGIAAASKAPDTAKAFIKFITRPEAAPVLKAKGFNPG